MGDVRDAGQELRRLREERHLTQRDVERMTSGKILAQQVSRLETGALSKPPMEDLVTLGDLYGLTPTQVAQLYGYEQRFAPPERPSALESQLAEEAEHMRAPMQITLPLPQAKEREAEQPHVQNHRDALHMLAEFANDLPDPLRQKLNHWAELLMMVLMDEMSTPQ